jgi:CheY-like chemotaxis protein
MKILVVEDDAEIRTLIAYFLKKEKYEVEICDNGLDALKLVTKFKPELIVLDLMLPNLDGISFTDMVRTINSGLNFVTSLRASNPLSQISTSYFSFFRKYAIRVLISASSSTTNIFIDKTPF